MHTIYKYKLDLVQSQEIELPGNHKILSVQLQDGNLCLWAKIVESEPRLYTFYIYGTGHPIPDGNLEYLDTVMINGLVWHIFIDPHYRTKYT